MQITKGQIITKDKLEVLMARLLIGDYILFKLPHSELIRMIKLGDQCSSSNYAAINKSWKLLLPENEDEIKTYLPKVYIIQSLTIPMDLFLIKYHEFNRQK